MALLDLFLNRAIKRGEVTITYPDGSERTFGKPDPELGDVGIKFTDKGAISALARDPAVGAAEMYMADRLQITRGTLIDLLVLFTANNRYEDNTSGLNPTLLMRAGAVLRYKLGRYNSLRRSKRNVEHHYDLSDRLYDLFLDADRQYSCAYFADPANTLEQAQHDKMAHIAAKLAIKPGMRVLDIGCGWGGMAMYLHQKTGAEVLGVTLSEEQIKVARERAAAAGVADKVKFELIDYREVTGTFDRIVSVGMFEHVGQDQYGVFLRKCYELLPRDGVMLLHTVGRANGPGITDKFTDKYIFPGGYTPALSEILVASEPLNWFTADIEQLRLHYAYTLKNWYDRVVANREAVIALYDERFYRMWTWYLAAFYVNFLNGMLVNYQIQFVRDRNAVPITRDYMAEEEKRLRG
ncbi:MAG: class I SAM-dependent methyltransferase [Sphingomonas sp.]|uniref:SAM-dependent methyltransferase n=1 Tax=Sphingomonas sp. TaxID=28214 RepID=UPI001AC5A57B|nr:cyclopropane-fatty-acyl-phospholipid synthase family protein [Sphingomonas sp.]MBN8815788.1 class I SAM-dependent methyltransferase [Sphingomonas sp.]